MRTILVVAAALLVTTAAIAQDKASQKFIIEAMQGNSLRSAWVSSPRRTDTRTR